MPATINVDKKSVALFLTSGAEHPFIIPEYQRPYEWEEDQIQTLFDDIWDFTTSVVANKDQKSTYFLGSIVFFENEEEEQEVIDGQQRITSLFLLLRAIYTQLQSAPDKDAIIVNFINKIAPTIWRTDRYDGTVDYDNILLESKVMNNIGNDILREILRTGKADPKAKDNYSKNYIKFQELYEKKSVENPTMIYEFILTLLDKAIVLPISADSQDTALTIFSTLNDRGLPLSDADIFKAKMYNHLDVKDKPAFIDRWRDLETEAEGIGESIQKLFYYYMFYLKALDPDINMDTTIPGLRKFYAPDKKDSKLFNDGLMDDLFNILDIWKVVNMHETIEGEPWSENIEILQSLDILTSYPNEFWKYPVIIYYLTYHENNNFESEFALFINKLLYSLVRAYLVSPTINFVKTDIIKLNIAVIDSSRPKFEFRSIDEHLLLEGIKNPNRYATRMLLKILAYEEQDGLLPEKWEIEHIFPQKWQSSYVVNVPDDVVKERIEHLGNKLPFEKKLNIVAGNGYFSKKKTEYLKSGIKITEDMGKSNLTDWNLDNITERDVRVSDTILKVLKRWDDEYNYVVTDEFSESALSEEDKALIDEIKKKGLTKFLQN